MEIVVRDLTEQDIDQIYKPGVLNQDFQVGETGFYDQKYLTAWLKQKNDDILLVANKDGQIVGFLFCRVMFRTWAMGENIMVLPKDKDVGVDEALFAECQKRLGKLGIDDIDWLARPDSNEE